VTFGAVALSVTHASATDLKRSLRKDSVDRHSESPGPDHHREQPWSPSA
jgi:hypothetical protein